MQQTKIQNNNLNNQDVIEGRTILQDGTASTYIIGLRGITEKASAPLFRVNVVKDSAILSSEDFTDYEEALKAYQKAKQKYLGVYK